MTGQSNGDIGELTSAIKELIPLLEKVTAAPQQSQIPGGIHQVMMPPPTSDERAVHRVEKKHSQMVVLNICMGVALILNWITDTNQTHVINAIYMMAPGLQEQVEAKKAGP
jgi:hypothetical protein